MFTDEGKRIDRAAALEPIDVHLAGRLRQARESRGWSRPRLAEEIGMSEQQIAKWEAPTNRMYAARLYAVALALGYPVAWFFDGFRTMAARAAALSGAAAPSTDVLSLLTPDTIRLLEQYTSLTANRQRLVRQWLGELAEPTQGDAMDAETDSGAGQPFAVRV